MERVTKIIETVIKIIATGLFIVAIWYTLGYGFIALGFAGNFAYAGLALGGAALELFLYRLFMRNFAYKKPESAKPDISDQPTKNI